MAEGDILLPDNAGAETEKKLTGDIPVDGAPADTGVLSNAPDEGTAAGVAKNLATGAIKGGTWIAGTPGDLMRMRDLGVAGVGSLFTGKTTAETLADIDRARERIGKTVRSTLNEYLPESVTGALINQVGPVLGLTNLPTSESMQKEIFKHTGEYVPQTLPGQLGQIGTAGAVSMLTPGGWKKAAEELATKGIGAGLRAAKAPAAQMASGAASAMAGEEVGKYAGPWAGTAASIAAFPITHYGMKALGEIPGNVTAASQRAGAGEMLRKSAQDAEKAGAALIGEGVGPQTLADITGDPGLAKAEAIAEKVGGPDVQTRIATLRDQQRTARGNLVQTLANPDADPSVVSSAIQKHMDNLQAEHDLKIKQAQTQAEQELKNAPPGADIEEISKRNQQRVYALDRQLKGQFDKLYKMIDPDKTMLVPSGIAREHGLQMMDRPPQVESNAAQPYLEAASKFPEVMPFAHLWDFDKQLTGAISKAGRAGDTNAIRELQDLKAAVKKTIIAAPEEIHQWQGEQVRAGNLNPDDTLAAAFQRQRDEWLAARAQGTGPREGAGPSADVSEGGVRPVPGMQGAPGGGPGGAGGGAGMEGLAPQPMDPATAANLAEINKLYGPYLERFHQGPVGEAISRLPFRDESGGVQFANKLGGTNAFVPGDKGALNVQAWLKADSSPQAIEDLKTLAAQRLRETLDDGVVDPRKLDTWKGKYANALRAIDEVSPGFSQSFDNAASATAAISAAEKAQTMAMSQASKTKAAKLLGLDSADDVTNKMGEFLGARDAYRQIDTAMGQIEHDPVALAGFRRAGADWITNNLDVATKDSQGNPVLSSARVEDLIRNKPDALRRLFGDEGADNLEKLQKTIAQEQTKQGYQRTLAGSDTATYLEPLYRKLGELQSSTAMQGLERLTEFASMAEVLHGNWEHAAMLVGGRIVLGTLEHFLQKWRAKGLQSQMDLFHEGILNPKFGQELVKESIETDKGNKISPLQAFLRARVAAGTQQETQGDIQRFGRAAGGAVKFDHAAEAARLIKAVEAARKEQAEDTKPLLKLPDETITRGLAVAGRNI